MNPNQILGYVLIGMIVGSPIMAGLAILGVILQAAFYQFIAKFMIGEGTFAEMAYALSAIFAPLTLLGVIFSLPIFFLNIAGGLLGLYGLFLTLVAIKGVNRLGWGGSCAVLVGVPILISACSCLVFYLIFASGAGLNDLLIQLTPIP